MLLSSAELDQMERRYRASFINSLGGFKSANLIGTADSAGHTNLAIMSSAVHLGAHPPLLLLIVRPDEVERHTLRNILETGVYTVNHVMEGFIDAAHQTAARYPKHVSEFAATGLTPHWQPGFTAPFVEEASIRLGLSLREHQRMEINGTHMVIGQITLVTVPDGCVSSDGSVDIAGAGTVAVSGLDSYHRPQPLRRMAYAKPDQAPSPLAPGAS
jgi:flavin reductase (DIM6/NTAB) family NADH-FMN oxidoreductase RutF